MATYGRVDEVSQCIDSLGRQSSRDFELIVVDQNPDDRLVPILVAAERYGFPVLHVRQDTPNQCIARNTGVVHARYNVLAFPDDDCWYDPDVVEKVLNRMAQADNPEGMVIRWAEKDPVGLERRVLTNEKMRRFREVDVSMIVMFFRPELFRELGNFDVTFGLHSWFGGSEETDLIMRFLAGDRRIVYEPNIIVHHPMKDVPVGAVGEQFRRFRSRARGMGGLYAKHQLATSVIVRGLMAPWLRMIFRLHQPSIAAIHAGTAIGRLEGYLRWKLQSLRNGGM